jgi:hypothetical protein
VLDANAEVTRRHFSMDALTGQLAALLEGAGWGHLLPGRPA